MRTILTIIAVFVLAISTGVLSVKAQDAEVYKGNWSAFQHDYSVAQDANTTLPASFFAAEAETASLERLQQRIAELEKLVEVLKSCECTCDCGKAKAPPAKLVMVSMPGCPACDQWWALERPRWEGTGWAVQRQSENPKPFTLYPYWRLCIGDECQTPPWCPFNQLDGKVQSILDKRRN